MRTRSAEMINRILIIGHGSIGKRHLRIVRETLPEADIRILRHQNCYETPEFSNGCFSSVTDACAFAPQATIIANPAPFHLDAAVALAMVGSHLLVEKPLSHSTKGIALLLQRVREQNLILQVGYNMRFLPSLAQFRDRILAGGIGQVLSVRCEIGQYLPSWRPGTDYRQGVSARHELGGGVLLELSHELDYLRWIFGEVSWVNAWLGQQSALQIDVEDTAHLILGFMSDTTTRHEVVAMLNLDFIRHDMTRLCTVIGETGSLRWDGVTGRMEECVASSNKWELVSHLPHQRDDSYRRQWQHFLSSIESEQDPLVNGEEGQATLSIIEAARQSAAAQGGRVSVRRYRMDNPE